MKMNKKEILKEKVKILNELINKKQLKKEIIDSIQEENDEVLDEKLKKVK